MGLLARIGNDLEGLVGLKQTSPQQPIVDSRPLIPPSNMQPMQRAAVLPNPDGNLVPSGGASAPGLAVLPPEIHQQLVAIAQGNGPQLGPLSYHPNVGLHYPLQPLPQLSKAAMLPEVPVKNK